MSTLIRFDSRPPYSAKALAVVGILVLGGCTSLDRTPITKPMNITKESEDEIGRMYGAAVARDQLQVEDSIVAPRGRSVAAPITSSTPPSLDGEPIGINFDSVPLPEFANTVFGDLLGVTFEIDSEVMSREQLVTLRTAEPLAPDEFYQLVTQVLSNYGVSVAYQNNVYRIVDSGKAQQQLPRIIRSRAFDNVPGDLRPVFYYAAVDKIRLKTMEVWLNITMQNRIQVLSVPYSNAVLLLGNPDDVEAAIEIIEILDQPALAGNQSVKISPAFWSVDRLAEQLVRVLAAEGYDVSTSNDSLAPIKLISIPSLNSIFVFSTDESNLKHVVEWASELDQPSQTVNTRGVFYHQVENTNAEHLAEVISELLDATGGTSEPGQLGAAIPAKVIVDSSRNALIFQGSAEEYAQFRSLVQQMDRAPMEVLIEATVAELTIDEGESLGVLLGFNDSNTASPNTTSIRSDDGLFVSLVRDRGRLTASLNALADESRVTILSSPRLVSSSGNSATMQVGTQVPIITTQQTAPDGTTSGSSNIVQQVQYRSTGVVLSIKPIVNSSRRVELTISQEVSDAQSNDTSDIQSPIILTRSIETNLSLDDGETVMLGGLISENYSTGNVGVPILKDIPLLGNLFKSSSQSVNKTELIVLLTPYIIDSRETSRAVRDAFASQLGDWASERFETIGASPAAP